MHINTAHELFAKYCYLAIMPLTSQTIKENLRQDISPNEGKHLEKIQPHHQNKVRISDFHRFIHEC